MKKMIMLAIAVCLLSTPAMATQKVGSVEVPETITLEGQELILNGAGIRKKFFIKLYVGALYVQEKSNNPVALINADTPMAIRLYITSGKITREKMLDAINEGFAAATGGNTAPIQSGIDALNACFSDEIKEGDVITLAYTPEKGIIMSKDGEVRGDIPGLDFKKALYAIWLGDKPSDKGLKKAMLN